MGNILNKSKMPQLAGGHSDEKEMDEEKTTLFTSDDFKNAVSEKAGQQFATFEPVKYKQQVVAGMIFHIKYKVDGDKFIHVKVYKGLPHMGNVVECQELAADQTADSPIENL